MYIIEETIHVLVIGKVGEIHISGRIDSILKQNYNREKTFIYIYIPDQEVTDILRIKYDFYQNIIFIEDHPGSVNDDAVGKREDQIYLESLAFVGKQANPNDIVVILDQGKYFVQESALKYMNQRFVDYKCWITYYDLRPMKDFQMAASNPIGLFAIKAFLINLVLIERENEPNSIVLSSFEQPIEGSVINSDELKLNPNISEKISKADSNFEEMDKGNNDEDDGLYKAQVLLRMLDLTGRGRIQATSLASIYDHLNSDSQEEISERHTKLYQMIENDSRSSPYLEDIHVFLCVWKRVHLLWNTLTSITKMQTTKRNVVVHLWNNNPEKRDEIDKIVSSIPGKIEVVHSDVNLYSYARFLHIRQAMNNYHIDFAIIIDDDEAFGKHYIERLYSERRPKVYRSWWGRVFNGGKYFEGDPPPQALNMGKRIDIKQFDYAGPGGCIIDTGIFSMKATYMIPLKFIQLDDLWISYVVAMSGWRALRTLVRPIFIKDAKSESVALWTNLKNEKDEFLNYLRAGGWKV